MMRKHYTAAFKAKVVQELLKEEKTFAQLAADYEVHPTQLKEWRARAVEGLPSLFEKQNSTAELQATHEEQLTEYGGPSCQDTKVGIPKSYFSPFQLLCSQCPLLMPGGNTLRQVRLTRFWGGLKRGS